MLNPVFQREMMLFRAKSLRFGYLFSTLTFPLIYLLALGGGLGRHVNIGGGSYIEFLIPGIVAMTSMTNAFNLTATSVGMGRLYFNSWQVTILAPLRPAQVVWGYIWAGWVRGSVAALLIALSGIIIFGVFPFTLWSLLGMMINLTIFSSLGIIAGLLISDMEDMGVMTNFVIMPMAFFSGTFFPLHDIPALFRGIVLLFPLTHINTLLRAKSVADLNLLSLAALLGITCVVILYAIHRIQKYSE